jgi:transposase
LIPAGAKEINNVWSVISEGGRWTYCCGVAPVFFHAADDTRSFAMFTAQLACCGGCKQSEIREAFGVSKSTLGRNVAKYADEGAEAFFAPRKVRGGSVITPDVKERVEGLLAQGKKPREVAEEVGVKYDTLRKAISQGRVARPLSVPEPPAAASDNSERSKPAVSASDKSARSKADAVSEMGLAAFGRSQDAEAR